MHRNSCMSNLRQHLWRDNSIDPRRCLTTQTQATHSIWQIAFYNICETLKEKDREKSDLWYYTLSVNYRYSILITHLFPFGSSLSLSLYVYVYIDINIYIYIYTLRTYICSYKRHGLRAQMAQVTNTIRSIVLQPRADLSTKLQKSILRRFLLTESENITSSAEVITPWVRIKWRHLYRDTLM